MLPTAPDNLRHSLNIESSGREDVPPEVLQQIVYHVLAQYIDDLMVGPLALTLKHHPPTMSSPDLAYEPEDTMMLAEAELRRSPENPMSQLLKVSYALRHVALEVIARTFNIQYIDEGPGRLVGGSPWRSLCQRRYDVWWASNGITLPSAPLSSAPPDEPEHPNESPVLAAYLATAVLQHEVSLVWTLLDTSGPRQEDQARTVTPWQLGIVQRWAHYGSVQLLACPDVFHDYPLFDRLCDAVLDSVIAELFGMYLYHMRCWWKVARRMYQHTAIQPLTGNPIAWAVSGPGNLENTVETLLSLLRDIPAMVARVDEVTSSMLQCPDEVSVDTIIGTTKYRSFINALSDIVHWDAEGSKFEACRSEARALFNVFSQRLENLTRWTQPEADDIDGCATVGAYDLRQEARVDET